MKRRLEKLEASVTGPGDGSEDLCPKCGGLQLETLMRAAEELEGEATPGESASADLANARCRRCGAPTLLALLADEVERWERQA